MSGISTLLLYMVCSAVAVDVWTRRLARVKCGLADCLLTLGVSSTYLSIIHSLVHSLTWYTLKLVDSLVGKRECSIVLAQDYSLVREVMETVREMLPDSEAEICSSLGRLSLQVHPLTHPIHHCPPPLLSVVTSVLPNSIFKQLII